MDVNKKCLQGFSPLLTATMEGITTEPSLSLSSQHDDHDVLGYRFCVAALLSSKFLDLNTTWQGMSPLTIAQQNGHRKIKEIILVGEERSELTTDCH